MTCCILILVVGLVLVYISPDCHWSGFFEPEDPERGIVPPEPEDIEEANSVLEDNKSNHGATLDVEDHS